MKSLLQGLRSRYWELRLNIWRLEGNERCSGEPLSILYAGHRLNKNYIAHLAFGAERKETYHGKTWIGSEIRAATQSGGEILTIIETAARDYPRYRVPGSFFIPCWIDGEIDLDQFAVCLSRDSVRGDLRRVRKYGLQFEVTKDREKFDLFYHQMYVPYIKSAHGDRAALMSYEGMMAKYAQSELLLIKRDGEYIAGENLLYENGIVRAWSLGVLNGDLRYVKEGAVGALYYYRMKYLREHGYRRLQIGASRAFLKDGVLCFKKKWDMRLVSARSAGFWMRPRGTHDGVVAFLKHNPFIYQKEDGFHGAVFLEAEEADTEDMIRPLHKRYGMRGLNGIDRYLAKGDFCLQPLEGMIVPHEKDR